MPELLLTTIVYARSTAAYAVRRLTRLARNERGEGVISAAIAVLIMAFLGAAMWLAFKQMFQSTAANTKRQVDQIGR
ncbi:MAG: hypothetical protein JWN46_1907 [Acidimicrobiales bacterium]|nr:hypothetical protein [Acidimicrobiales bacterium]